MRSSIDTQHLQHLQVLRAVIVLVQASSVWLSHQFLSHSQQQGLVAVLLCEALVIVVTRWRMHHNQKADELPAHLFIDAMLLSALLYLAGGATNPFVSYYLVPIAVSAATLSIRTTALLTAFCLLAYSLLMYYFQPLRVLSPQAGMVLYSHDHHAMQMMANDGPNLHVVGMWLNFGFSAMLITYFVTRMAETLRQRETELTNLREKQLRDGQVLAIATLAAGTAHELGTPLSTLAILANDLQSSAKQYPELADDIAVMVGQVAASKRILQNLSKAAEQQQAGELQTVGVNEYLAGVLTHWQLLHPAIAIEEKSLPTTPGVAVARITVEVTLEQALMNLLNNAAEAGAKNIQWQVSVVQARNGSGDCCIEIHDDGKGITLDPQHLGKPFVSSRGQGRGLGLFLSRAAIERLGGTMNVKSPASGGTLTQVTLPLT